MKKYTKTLSSAAIVVAFHLINPLAAQDLTVDGNLYVRGNIELEDSIRMRDVITWRGTVTSMNQGEVFYIVLSENNEYVFPDLTVTITGDFTHTLMQGSISKKFSFRHYSNGNLYGPIETEFSNYGFLRRKICIGEPDSSSDGLRIPILYYNTNNYDRPNLRIKVEYSKGYIGSAGQPGNYTDWTPTLTTPEPYDTSFYTDAKIETWNTKKLYGTVALDQAQGDISMGVFGAQQ